MAPCPDRCNLTWLASRPFPQKDDKSFLQMVIHRIIHLFHLLITLLQPRRGSFTIKSYFPTLTIFFTSVSFSIMKFQLLSLALVKLAMCQPFVSVAADEDPHAIDGNIKGSSMCRTIDNDECGKAIQHFVDDQRYTERTEIAVGYYHYGLFGEKIRMTGCKAEWSCDDNSGDYEKGITGKGIKDAYVFPLCCKFLTSYPTCANILL